MNKKIKVGNNYFLIGSKPSTVYSSTTRNKKVANTLSVLLTIESELFKGTRRTELVYNIISRKRTRSIGTLVERVWKLMNKIKKNN